MRYSVDTSVFQFNLESCAAICNLLSSWVSCEEKISQWFPRFALGLHVVLYCSLHRAHPFETVHFNTDEH